MSRLVRITSRDSSQIFHLRASGDEEIYTSPLDNSRSLCVLNKTQDGWKLNNKRLCQVELGIKVKIPRDFEILQILYHSGLPATTLLSKLTPQEAEQLSLMFNSVKTLVQIRLKDLEVLPVLPAISRCVDFYAYCLTLPRKRIRRLIENPPEEITKNEVYYVTIPKKGVQNAFDDYLEERSIKPSDALKFILGYKNILSEK